MKRQMLWVGVVLALLCALAGCGGGSRLSTEALAGAASAGGAGTDAAASTGGAGTDAAASTGGATLPATNSAASNAEDGPALPSAASFLNTKGVVLEEQYSVTGIDTPYCCVVYDLPDGEGGSADLLAYQWKAQSMGYTWSLEEGDGFTRYTMEGGGVVAFLDVYAALPTFETQWRLYYPEGCRLTTDGDGSSFQNDSFGITVDPDWDGRCPSCNGTGSCVGCLGTGRFQYGDREECTLCGGTGDCNVCGGAGWCD